MVCACNLFRIPEAQMKRVTGIGGIFFNAREPVTLRAWYQKHLGIDVQTWGGAAFTWADTRSSSGSRRPGSEQEGLCTP